MPNFDMSRSLSHKISYGPPSFIVLCLFFCSCATTKKTRYFQDIADTGRLKNIARAEYVEPRIQVDDILTVMIQTIDPQASALVNSGNIGVGQNNPATAAPIAPVSAMTAPVNTNANAPLGYLVDKEGTITIPVLGKIKVEGMTTSRARDRIQSSADSFYKSSSVTVRFANFKVNIAGEVARPGTYTMPNEKVSILDAITMAGDLTVFGKRGNVLLLRENPDGTRTPYRFDLRTSNFLTSPYFYLRQNDYIYVEPDKSKAASLDQASARNYAILASVLTVIIVIATRVK
jgi:polysaccharide export outer membrane protein